MAQKKQQSQQEDTALAVFASSAPAEMTNVPEYLREHLGNRAGSDNLSHDDVLIPRLCLAQDGMSPQLKKSSESFIPGLEAGQMFDSVTGEIYGERVKVVPLMFFKNWIEFNPINQGGGVKAMYDASNPPNPADLAFGQNEKNERVPPAVTEFKNRLCLLIRAGHAPRLIVVSFKSSGLKAAKKWNALIRGTNLPCYARSYDLTVVNKRKGEQTWFGLDVMPDVFVPQEFFASAKAQFEAMENGGFKIDTSGLEEEERSSEFNTAEF